MLPEDRLDALLSTRGALSLLPPPSAWPSDEDAALGPLLAAAARLAPLTESWPDATFAQALEERLLARAAALAGADLPTQIGYTAPTLPGSDFPTLPGAQTYADTYAGAPTQAGSHPSAEPMWRNASSRSGSTPSVGRRETRERRGFSLRRSRYPRLLPQAIAASLLLLLTVGTLTAAAAAGPGSFLFPLHRIEQGIQLGLSGSAADRVRLHLGYASNALTALNATQGRGARNESAYAQALATLRDEERAAEQELVAVPAGTEHDDLSAQLQSFKTRATHDLYAALSADNALDWQNRVATTLALGQLGARVPRVDTVRIVRAESDGRSGDDASGSARDSHSWMVTITGDGFMQGTVVSINGHSAGTVVQLSAKQIVALIKADDPRQLAGVIGVEALDGTAAQTSNITLIDGGHISTLPATATPGSHSDDGHSGKGGSHDGTPTPTVTPTPMGGK